MKRLFLVPVLGLATVALSGSAQAQSVAWLGNNDRPAYAGERQSYNDARRAAYDNGYREGLKQGGKDGRRRDVFRYEDEKTFQRADKGFHREFGDIERYRQSFRSGYAAGYSESYQRYAPAYGSNGRYGDRNGRAVPRRDTRDRGTYPDTGSYPRSRYPEQYPGNRPGDYPGDYGGGYTNLAVRNGINDGFEKGSEDARRNRSADPLRHEWYRSGDRHYEGRFGSREQYKDLYRQGFQEGYDRGYREGRYR
jgi:hypothetical protein